MHVAAQDEQPTSCDARRLASDVSYRLGYILWHFDAQTGPSEGH